MQLPSRSARGARRARSILAAATALAGALAVLLPAGQAAADVTIQRGFTGKVETLDPQKASTAEEAAILVDMFDGLVTVDALGRLVPGAAESWTISPDGLVYTFKLREDGIWSNGEALKAADFVASFRRLFDPATGATEDGPLQVIRGAILIKQGLAKPETLGVKALDPLTLEITLEQPTPTFELRLAQPVALPVFVASIKKLGADFGTTGKVVSNGAYRIGAVDRKDGYTLLKNPKFHAADGVAADTVVYRPFAEAEDCLAAFEAKAVMVCSDVPTGDLGKLRAEVGPALQVAPYEGTYFYAFNTAKKPFDDPRVRRALSMAIDREALASEAWSGGMVPAESLVPRDLSARPQAPVAPIAERRQKASALLAEAGFDPKKPGAKPLALTIRVGTGTAHEQTAKLIAEQWKDIGVEAKIVTESNSDHYQRLRDGGDFDIARAGWILDEPDAVDMLTLLLSGNKRFNYARYANAGYDEIVQDAEMELDPALRLKQIADAETVIARDQPFMPLLGYASLSLVSPNLKGWQANVVNVHPSRFLSLAP